MWWAGDRSTFGLVLTLALTAVGTLVVQLFVFLGIYQCARARVCGMCSRLPPLFLSLSLATVTVARRYTNPDFFLVHSWMPALIFAGSVAVGTLGRQLTLVH